MEDRIVMDIEAVREEIDRLRSLSGRLDGYAQDLRAIGRRLSDMPALHEDVAPELTKSAARLYDAADGVAHLIRSAQYATELFEGCERWLMRKEQEIGGVFALRRVETASDR